MLCEFVFIMVQNGLVSMYCYNYGTNSYSLPNLCITALHPHLVHMHLLIEICLLRVLTWNDRSSTLAREHTSGNAFLVEQQRDIFEIDAFGLRVKEIDHGDERGVENAEDDERAPLDIRW